MPTPLAFGIYDPGCPPRVAALGEHAKRLGTAIRVVSWYQAWGSGFSKYQGNLVKQAQRQGAAPLITWEPWRLPGELAEGRAAWDQPDFTLKAISGGRYDAYIRAWALGLAATRRMVLLRPMHEMNGDWYPWGGTVNGNRPEDFLGAWERLRKIFREEGADNVRWVWCPYARSVPEDPANGLERYFPGAGSVDWLALDGYNWGSSRPWARWESFLEIFEPAYDRLRRLSPDQPIMIAEVGCATEGGNKARWIREALQSLPARFSRVRALVWFDICKECDWRIASTPRSLAAFRSEAWRFGTGSLFEETGDVAA
jgi:beta-mannanase